MIETLITHVEAIEAMRSHLPLASALADDDRVDAAMDAAMLGLTDYLATLAGVMIERAIREEG